MPNVLKVTCIAQLIVDGAPAPQIMQQVASAEYSIASNLSAAGVQNIGTSPVNLNFGSVTAEGYAAFTNLDPDNYVQIGWDDGGFQPAMKLLPRGSMWVALEPSRTWQAKADTGPVDLQVHVAGV